MPGARRFVVDAMLGNLARWLRILGEDVAYSTTWDDDEVLELAKREGRAIITRDKALARRAEEEGVEVALLPDGPLELWLAILARRFGISLEFDARRSRCPLCNSRLRPASRPDEVRTTWAPPVEAGEYWVCPRCGQVYWRGRHFAGIERRLREARRLLKFLDPEG